MEDDGHRGDARSVVIAGAGVAGLEVALGLRELAGERTEVCIHDPRREFVFRPFAVGESYGASRAFRYDMRRLTKLCGALWRAGGIVSLDADQRYALTRDGERVAYDCFVAAPGARMLWAVPGAVTFWGVADEGQVADVIADLRAGGLRRLVFTMPSGHSWAMPLYELALFAATERDRVGGEARITVVTPENAPLDVFGRRGGEQIRELLAERGIEVVAHARPVEFESGRLRIAGGEELDADAVITLPRLEGQRIGGIPHDRNGFVEVDEHGAVPGLEGVYAAGDVTAFPVKQGGIATRQADAVAEAIAAASGAELEPRPFDSVLRSVLWTGQGPRYLYAGPGDGPVLSEHSQRTFRNGSATARYLTPLVDALSIDGQAGQEEPLDVVRASSAP